MESLEKLLSRQERIATEIQNKSETLNNEHVTSIDLLLSENEIDALNKFKLPEEYGNLSFDYYGASDAELKTNLHNVLNEIEESDSNNIDAIVDIVNRTATGFVKGIGHESMWLTLRITLPDEAFDVPRWHTDGKYYNTDKPVYKLAATLKGSQTLLAKITNIEKFNVLGDESHKNSEKEQAYEEFLARDIEIRKEIEQTVEEINISVYGEGVIFRVGDEQAVPHSEPPSTALRIFMSVVGGTKEQIKELETTRNV